MNTNNNNLYSKQLKDAAELIRNSKHTAVFSGEGGLWERINPLSTRIMSDLYERII